MGKTFRLFSIHFFFSGLYFVQGAILAYVSNFQKPYLRDAGVSVGAIAMLTSAMLLPFIFKILFGFISDRFSPFGFGHRKPYMLFGLAIGSLCFWGLRHVDPGREFSIFFALMVTATFGMALFDTATDGFAIDINRTYEDDHSSSIQSFMMSGKAFGYIALSGFFGWLAGRQGFATIFAILSATIAGVFLWVLFFAREPKGRIAPLNPDEKLAATSARFGRVRNVFQVMGGPVAFFAIYAVLYSICSFGIDGIVTLYLHAKVGLRAEDIGSYGVSRGCGAIVGAMLAGAFSTKIRRDYVAYGSMIFLSLGTFAFLLAKDSVSSLWLGAVWGCAWSFQETVFVTLAMLMAGRALAATAFAVFMIFSNIGTAIGEGLATALSGGTAFARVFVIFGFANLLVAAFLIFVFRANRERLLA